MYKLLVLDLDGTILDEKFHISPAVLESIKKAKTKIDICFCSGRSKADTLQIVKKTGVNGVHICEGGAKIIDSNGKILFTKYLKEEITHKIFFSVKEMKVKKVYYCNQGRDVENKPIDFKSVSRISFTELDTKKHGVIFNKLKKIKKTTEIICYNFNGKKGIDIQAKGVSKGMALSVVKKIKKIKKSQVIAIGDGFNDLPVFAESKTKIAMENAEPELKKVADFICPSIKEGGVVCVIDDFFNDC